MGGASTNLGSPLDPTFNISLTATVWRAAWTIAGAIISILFGGYTIAVLFTRPWRPTLVFIIILLMSDWFKAFWQFVYSVYWFVYQPVGLQEQNSWCQAEGFLFSWAVEMSDFTLSAMLTYVAFGVATRLHRSSGLVHALSCVGYTIWFCMPIVAAALAFINGDRYTNQSTTCYLPVRPFWYRLGLSWIPRYFMLFISSSLILWLFIYVRAKHRSFIMLLRRPAEESSAVTAQRSVNQTIFSPMTSPITSPMSQEFAPGVTDDQHPAQGAYLEPPTPELRTNNLLHADDPARDIKSTGTGNSMATESVNNSAEEVLRRLRRLWVYPLVYFLYWTIPFAYHAMTYKVYFVMHPIPVLAVFSSTILALHCALMSAAVWFFERPGDKSDTHGKVSVWVHIRDSWRPSKLFDSRQWDKSVDQRQTATFARQRLAIEREEHRAQRARRSQLSSMANVRNSLFVDEQAEQQQTWKYEDLDSVEKAIELGLQSPTTDVPTDRHTSKS